MAIEVEKENIEFEKENKADLENLEEFAGKLRQEFENKSYQAKGNFDKRGEFLGTIKVSVNDVISKINSIRDNDELIAKLEGKTDTDSMQKLYELKRKREEGLKLIASELFIAACASDNSIKDVLEFKEKFCPDLDINKFNKRDINPVIAVMASGNKERLEEFLKIDGVDLTRQSDVTGNTIFHKAAEMGVEKDVFDILIDNIPEQDRQRVLNIKNKNGLTALDVVISRGDIQTARFLSDKGAQPNLFSMGDSLRQGDGSKDGGRQRGDLEDRIKQFNERNSQEDFEKNEKMMEEMEKQKEEAQRMEDDMRRAEELRIQIELHHDIKEFFAAELKKLRDAEAQELEAKALSEQQEQEDPKKAQEQNEEEAQKDPNYHVKKLLAEQLGIAIEDVDKINIHSMLHKSAADGRDFLSKMLVRLGADVNYKEGGVSVLEAVANTRNSGLLESLSFYAAPITMVELRDRNQNNPVVDALFEKRGIYLNETIAGKDLAYDVSNDIRGLDLAGISHKTEVEKPREDWRVEVSKDDSSIGDSSKDNGHSRY